MALNDRQERFCLEYIVDCNAVQAYIRAGYKPKGAEKLACRMMGNDGVKSRIAELMAEKDAKLIAKGEEVLKYLTAVMRGEYPDGKKVMDDVAMVTGCGDGVSAIEHTKVEVGTRERTKAAELLGKRYGLFTDKVSLEGAVPVTIVNDIPGAAEGEESTNDTNDK